MKEIVVAVPDKPGQLAKVAEILANNSINIKSIATERTGKGSGLIKVIANSDEKNAARILQEKGNYKVQVSPLLVISLVDRPGELANVSKALAALNVNINSLYIVGNAAGASGRKETQVALNVDNFAQAEKVLEPFIIREGALAAAK